MSEVYHPMGTGPTRDQMTRIKQLADHVGWNRRRLDAEARRFTGGPSLTKPTAELFIGALEATERRGRAKAWRRWDE